MWFDYSACGGVALYTEWVLTAAHCVEQFGYIWPREQWYYVYTGVSSTGVGDKKEITEIIIHEQYKENKECEFCHDIALLRVKPKIKAGSIVQKHSGSAENTYKDCVQIGLHHINGTTNMGGLAKNIITVKPDMACENINVAANQPEAYYNSTIMMCGHSRDKWTGVLPGDSGSPVICHELSGHIVVGVQSHKIKTRDSNRNEYPEIFTRYSAYVDWIDKRIHHRQ